MATPLKLVKLENGELVEDTNITDKTLVYYEDIKPYLTPPVPEPSEYEVILQAVIKSFQMSRQSSKAGVITPEDRLDYLELDSLDMVELEMDLSDQFGREYDDTDIERMKPAKTVKDLAAIIQEIHQEQHKFV
jgi:acyl carrier protein